MQSQASFISTLVRITTKITSHEYSLTKKGVAFFNATPWKYLAERKRFYPNYAKYLDLFYRCNSFVLHQ